MIRVAVDSNIYISSLVFGGLPERLRNLIHSDMIQSEGASLFVSKFIVDEVSGTLAGKFGGSRQDLQEFLPSCGSDAP